MSTLMINALQSPQGRTNTVLMNSLLVKLSEYKQRQERYRQWTWDASPIPEHTFWWVDVSVKIELIERLLAHPDRSIALDEYLTELQARDDCRHWTNVIWDNRMAVMNAFGVTAQYIAGERTVLHAPTFPSTFN